MLTAAPGGRRIAPSSRQVRARLGPHPPVRTRKVPPHHALHRPSSAAPRRHTAAPARWLRRLAAPVAGLLIASFAVGLAPATAHGAHHLRHPVRQRRPPAPSSPLRARPAQLQDRPGHQGPGLAPLLRGDPAPLGHDRRRLSEQDRRRRRRRHDREPQPRRRRRRDRPGYLPEHRASPSKAGDTIRLEGVVAGLDPVLTYVRAWKVGTTCPSWQLAARDYDGRPHHNRRA